jgi:hypothetical protein
MSEERKELSDKLKNLGLDFRVVSVGDWWSLEVARKDGVEYHRKQGSLVVYRAGDNGFSCVDCGSEIKVAKVDHSVQDGGIPLAGHGEVETDRVPYCPKCEQKPSEYGMPIIVPMNRMHRPFS